METRGISKEKYESIEKLNEDKPGRDENLSFSDIERLMRYRSYKRINGAVRQIK